MLTSTVDIQYCNDKNKPKYINNCIFQESTLEDNVVIKNEIRIKLGQGIAGMVALTGSTLNIPDAYKVRRSLIRQQ